MSEEGETMRSYLRTKREQQLKVNPTDRSGLTKRKKRPAPPPPPLLTRPPFSHVPGKGISVPTNQNPQFQ